MAMARACLGARLVPLLAGVLLFLAPLAAGQETARPVLPHPTPELRSRLAELAKHPGLERWQREFMLDMAGEGTRGSLIEPSPALRGASPRTVGPAGDDGGWIGVPPPPPRFGTAAIYDPVRDRMLVFGGYDFTRFKDVWELSLVGNPTWSALAHVGAPPSARAWHSAIYDPVRDRVLVFGGWDGSSYRNDMWALSLAGDPVWSALAPAGSPPSGRLYHKAIYDPIRDRMLVFGGEDAGGYCNDVWALSLEGETAWNMLTPAGTAPSARIDDAAIYDPVRDRMLVFGGWDNRDVLNDVWALSLAGDPIWTELAPAGTLPVGRGHHTAIYDAAADRMVVFGGLDGSVYRNDAWALSLSGIPTWTELAPTGTLPAGRDWHTAICDPVRDRMVVFAGVNDGGVRNDVWALSLTGNPTWSTLAPEMPTPSRRTGHSAIYDPVHDRMVVFGGDDGGSGFRRDVWALSLSGSPGWTALAPLGTPPPRRVGHSAIYDPVGMRMLVFGGYDGNFYLNDVWALSLSEKPTWSALAPTGTPPPGRQGQTAIYDGIRKRVLVFGGYDTGFRNDVWALSLSGDPAWTALVPTGVPPPPRAWHTAVCDMRRYRMVIFGGWGVGWNLRNDVWALTLLDSTWRKLAPAGTPPSERDGHAAIDDPVRDRMVVFGGYHDGSRQSDVWALSYSGGPTWSALAPTGTSPSGRAGQTAVYDLARDRMILFGGTESEGVNERNDVWALTWGTPVSVEEGSFARVQLGAPRPNPSRRDISVDFELAKPAWVVLEVFDVQGRKVRRIADGWFSAGRHASSWQGDDDRGRALGSGVYMIRMQAGGIQLIRRTVRIH